MRYHPPMKVCFSCGAIQELERRPLRAEECAACCAPLHCCKNCRFWDPNVHNECLETRSDMVRDREGSNFCDYFEYRKGASGADSAGQESAKDKLARLFKS
jgi:hypothetical protein